MTNNAIAHPQFYHNFGLTPIPLKPRSKEPLVKWGDGWNPTAEELERWSSKPEINWGVRCGEELAVLDFDDPNSCFRFIASHPLPPGCPIVKTGRGFHIWMKPRKPIPSQKLPHLSCELKCQGSYIVVPPSIHHTGVIYSFVVPPDGAIPEVDLEELLGLGQVDSYTKQGQCESIRQAAPSDFALRYGKSPYPQSMCGKATKILTRSDGKIKHLVSLRCWKWNCPKCAPLLKRLWMEKLSGISFRFILRLPDVAKPTKFLRRVGKPPYVHILAGGESWLFLLDGEAGLVWAEARSACYELVAGDVAGNPTPEEIAECLDLALCREEKPLNTRRKTTHSKGLLKKGAQNNAADESKCHANCEEGENEVINTVSGKEPLTWESEIVMKPIEQVAAEHEQQGWRIVWKSEVEALAIKGEGQQAQDVNSIELLNMLGIKLKRVGKEYMALCPFHDDHEPSLSVNIKKGLWHCFGCGKGGDAQKLMEEWQALID
jgi:hypothetical protein